MKDTIITVEFSVYNPIGGQKHPLDQDNGQEINADHGPIEGDDGLQTLVIPNAPESVVVICCIDPDCKQLMSIAPLTVHLSVLR